MGTIHTYIHTYKIQKRSDNKIQAIVINPKMFKCVNFIMFILPERIFFKPSP